MRIASLTFGGTVSKLRLRTYYAPFAGGFDGAPNPAATSHYPLTPTLTLPLEGEGIFEAVSKERPRLAPDEAVDALGLDEDDYGVLVDHGLVVLLPVGVVAVGATGAVDLAQLDAHGLGVGVVVAHGR